MHYVKPETKIYYIDPKPAIENNSQITVIAKSATKGIKDFIEIVSE
jgi:NAD-dependent deacetylase